MRLPIYQVDAFSDRVFGGNPAAVVLLSDVLPDATLQAIAAENNLSETAFLLGEGGRLRLRWFTPVSEVDLCGHATLAAAHVLFRLGKVAGDRVFFQTRSGELSVQACDDGYTLDFPAWALAPIESGKELDEALGARPSETLEARDLVAVFDREEEVRALRPDFQKVADLGFFAVSATAPGREVDFVSRFFAPAQGIPEDPVTGSVHCALAPFWAKRLGKTRLTAEQLSSRGGTLVCECRGDRVLITGSAADYLSGEICLGG